MVYKKNLCHAVVLTHTDHPFFLLHGETEFRLFACASIFLAFFLQAADVSYLCQPGANPTDVLLSTLCGSNPHAPF